MALPHLIRLIVSLRQRTVVACAFVFENRAERILSLNVELALLLLQLRALPRSRSLAVHITILFQKILY